MAKVLGHKAIGWGDAAVDGLLNGVLAGLAMGLYLAASALLWGDAPATVLARFDPSAQPSPVVGTLLHLAVSGVYGALFGIIWEFAGRSRVNVRAWMGGLAYGLLLLAIAATAITSGATWLKAIPFIHVTVAHIIYGLALGYLTGRGKNGARS
ncbi:MAG: hypothetical protein HY782_25085 [Chloroflexi bacterium]|nr:hypothetical protein [Chloroflexota bacterium]